MDSSLSDKEFFIYNDIFPDVNTIFNTNLKSLEDIKDNCCVILDTNVLLMPYTVSKTSIDELKKVYEKLLDQDRLFIPGQVVREFAKNRPSKIKEVYQQLLNKKSRINKLKNGQYPLLKAFNEYEELILLENEIDELIEKYKKKLNQIVDKIRSWNWNDPVSKLYSDLFNENCIVDYNFSSDEEKNKFVEEFQKRNKFKLPPGYKDSSNDYNPAGDLIIWKTIINIANEKDKDIVFVSGDKKADWWHRSDSEKLYLRYELVYEFKQKTKGHSIQLIQLSTLLDLFDVNEKAIDEIKEIEDIENEKNSNYKLVNSFEQSIEYNEIIKQWSDFLKYVKKHDINLSAYLIEGTPIYFTDNTLIIGFPKDKKFHKNGVLNKMNKLQKYIANYFNCSFDIGVAELQIPIDL